AKSAKELQFALRGVPAQFTDIATSLSSGQRPLQVLLQQGGQLKDMFGGIGPAAKALGGYVVGLINPLTIGAATLGAFAFALNQAEEEQSAFNKALLVSGNYAGKTSAQLESLVSAIARTSDVTQGTAREAIQRAAESGRFAGDQFDIVARAAARMEEATGQSVDATIKKFEAIGRAPVDALLKLNETEHFLTQAQLDRVRALVDEGREQDAAAEGARIYAGRLDAIATSAEAARPHLAQMWKDAKEGASSAWQETKNFAEFLAGAAEQYKKMPWWKQATPVGALSSLYGVQPAQPVSVAPVAGTVDSAKAGAYAEFQKEGLRYATKQARLEQDIAKAKADGLRAGASQLEIDQRITAIRASYADKTAKQRATPNFRVQDINELRSEVEAEGKLMDQRLKSQAAVIAYRASLQDMLDTRQKSIDLQVAALGMGDREIAQQQALIAIDEDYNRQKASLERQQRNSTSEIDKAGYGAQLQDLKRYHDERVKIETEGFSRSSAARENWVNGAQAATQNYLDNAKDIAGATSSVVTNVYQGLTDNLAEFFAKGKADWKGFVKDILLQIEKIEIAKAVAGIGSSLSGAFGFQGGTSASTFAKGGVFESPSLSQYSGQIVTQPTAFAFAKGAGIMGEAGP
ncbi:phage tail tape measure protein, partial [Rhodanobacter denitrificans]|nr:phage tail tape measure protein [Rhodanobacter denitrificans]